MPHHRAAYAVHRTLRPRIVDEVSFDLGGLGIHEFPVHAKVVNRSTTPGEEIFFDFNYPGQVPPPATIVPNADNTFVVLPGQVWEMQPGAQVPLDYVVVSEFATAYSIMVYV